MGFPMSPKAVLIWGAVIAVLATPIYVNVLTG